MSDPFAVLGCAPTLDLAAIKRAYYLALPKCPPHADPEGFRRLRAAYEELLQSERRASRYMEASLSASALLAEYRGRFDAKLDAARTAASAGAQDAELNARFAGAFERMTLAQAIERTRG